MKKSIKIISVLLFLLVIVSTISLATDINMNLSSQTNNQNSNTMTKQTGNVLNNSLNSSTSIESSSATVTSTTSSQDDSLGVTNIVNIILIAVRNCFNTTCYRNINSLTLNFYKRYIKFIYLLFFAYFTFIFLVNNISIFYFKKTILILNLNF